MTLLEVLLANIDEAYDHKGWHGTTLRGAIRNVHVELALRRPREGAHNIWEYVLHAAYWKYAVRRRLTGEKRGTFALKGSNWFGVPERASEESWHDSILVLDEAHHRLRDAVVGLSARALNDAKKVRMVYGIAAHDLYHAGQIQLVKRLVA